MKYGPKQLQQIKSLESLIDLATKEEDLIRSCCYCNSLINNDTGMPMFLTEFQKHYLNDKYFNQLTHGVDQLCYDIELVKRSADEKRPHGMPWYEHYKKLISG